MTESMFLGHCVEYRYPKRTVMKPTISVVINTLNEEHNLPYALRSVHSWADEIIVVDMYSEDRTVEIAKDYGAKVFFHERIAAFDGARQFAIDQASNEWVLVLDADELVPEPLSRKFADIISADNFDVVFIPWLNFLLGAALMHTGWGPDQDKHPRFFKKNKMITSSTIHEFMQPAEGARIQSLKFKNGYYIVHFNYVDTNSFLTKLNRYTDVEAIQAHDRNKKYSGIYPIFIALKEFLRRYLRKKGYRDGWRGLYLSLAMAFYRLTTFAKLRELNELGGRDQILSRYHIEAEHILAKYDILESDR